MTTVIRLNDVMRQTKLSRSTIYKLIKEQTFPKPFPLGARSVGWTEQQISDWIEQQAEKANQGTEG